MTTGTRSLEDILRDRASQQLGSERWNELNEEKAVLLEQQKSSLLEVIVCFHDADLSGIPSGYAKTDHFPDVPFFAEKRSLVEYHPEKRHPIPYILLRNGDSVFVSTRKSGGGESRLHGKMGLLGGHVGIVDIEEGAKLSDVLHRGMIRELQEEVHFPNLEDIIETKIVGTIKMGEGDCVESDHLGVIYEVWTKDQSAYSKEEDTHFGEWIAVSELSDHVDRMENWMQLVYDEHLVK